MDVHLHPHVSARRRAALGAALLAATLAVLPACGAPQDLTAAVSSSSSSAAASASSSHTTAASSASPSASASTRPSASGSASTRPSPSATRPAGVSVKPNPARAGSALTLTVSGCKGTGGIGSSTAFSADAPLSPAPGGGNLLTGTTTVTSTALPGTYPVAAACAGGGTVTGTLTVMGAPPSNGHIGTGAGGSVTHSTNPALGLLGALLLLSGAAAWWRARPRANGHDRAH
ncbi:hypothetical protein ABUW04_00315 [Streptacidiphilus sp. N1-10]|uniref:Ig-like domain-containing protein n=1 Tax=Streptacidiphilus jeojiensis TaxID=3229225 RepID=A0ABV6XEK6_9ACTN